MDLKQLFYRTIYEKNINFLLRNFNFRLSFLLPSKIKIPPSGVFKLKTDSGTIKFQTNQTSYLTQLLFWNGYKEFEYSEIFEKLVKKTNTFLDIGANIGYYSLLATISNPTIKIYAFEPACGPKYYLKKNILLNGFQNNINFQGLALSETIGTIEFYEVKSEKYNYLQYNLSGENNAGTKTVSRNFLKIEVESMTLSAFIENENITSIELIKIDTEGTEVEILKSGKNYIEKFMPIIICETLFHTTENLLTDFFSKMDYEFYNHTEKGLKKVDTITRTKDNGIRNCFFVPIKKRHLISEFIDKKEN